MSDLIISADSHVIETPTLWVDKLPKSMRDRAPTYPELKTGNKFQTREGGSNPKARIKEMALDGVSAEVLYPSFALDQFGITDPDLQEACFRLYNDWLIEYCAYSPERLFGVACISTYRIDNAVKEMTRCKKAGLRGVEIWQIPPDGSFSIVVPGFHGALAWEGASSCVSGMTLEVTGALDCASRDILSIRIDSMRLWMAPSSEDQRAIFGLPG